ncbi:hypothetical protein R3P38DRAFT_3227093 [Favolaschia claudopus]|uniref:Uncharacterized protein n=1 Tax=Favolaschia claudopus TaxID=2862362 RepID=A0AAV9ZT32_9AGAR
MATPQFLRTFIPTALSFEANYSASTNVLIVLSLGTLQPLLPEGMPGASPGMALAGGSEPSTPAPTPAIIAVGHTAIPLAETLPTAQDAPSPLLVRTTSPAPNFEPILIRLPPWSAVYLSVGTDQQIGEALIALGKRFMRPSRLSGDPAPPPPGPVPVLPNASGEGARPLKKRAHPVHPSQPPAPVPPPPAASASAAPRSLPTPPLTPYRITLPPSLFLRSSTPYAPSVSMPTAIPSPSPRSVAPTPMAIDAIRPERGRRQQTARRGGAVSASDSRIDSQGNLLFRGDPGF